VYDAVILRLGRNINSFMLLTKCGIAHPCAQFLLISMHSSRKNFSRLSQDISGFVNDGHSRGAAFASSLFIKKTPRI